MYVTFLSVLTTGEGSGSPALDHNSPRIHKLLKEAVHTRGFDKQVRVSACGCMGLCGQGPNVLLHPQRVWFAGVSEDDTGHIVAQIAAILKNKSP